MIGFFWRRNSGKERRGRNPERKRKTLDVFPFGGGTPEKRAGTEPGKRRQEKTRTKTLNVFGVTLRRRNSGKEKNGVGTRKKRENKNEKQ